MKKLDLEIIFCCDDRDGEKYEQFIDIRLNCLKVQPIGAPQIMEVYNRTTPEITKSTKEDLKRFPYLGGYMDNEFIETDGLDQSNLDGLKSDLEKLLEKGILSSYRDQPDAVVIGDYGTLGGGNFGVSSINLNNTQFMAVQFYKILERGPDKLK
ncbi:MAG: hypothetical protein PHE43_00955 [Candidatus Nanoarchaeia archaeon]|nr:hypothetical protein [Candidatus Nanoarchaeia archaeon]